MYIYFKKRNGVGCMGPGTAGYVVLQIFFWAHVMNTCEGDGDRADRGGLGCGNAAAGNRRHEGDVEHEVADRAAAAGHLV